MDPYDKDAHKQIHVQFHVKQQKLIEKNIHDQEKRIIQEQIDKMKMKEKEEEEREHFRSQYNISQEKLEKGMYNLVQQGYDD